MRKLQWWTAGSWQYVFCHNKARHVVITTKTKSKALPPRAIWGEDDLAYFRSQFAGERFRLAE